MATNTKLAKVLEYLIKNDEEKARELLHQVFIEKARSIHEELMSDEDEDMPAEEEIDENFGGSGDQGADLTNDIQAMDDEIDFEETVAEAGDEEEEEGGEEEIEIDSEEPPMGDDLEDPESEEGGMAAVQDKMTDLDTALAALKAEFEKMEGGESEDPSAPPSDMPPGPPMGDDEGMPSLPAPMKEENGWDFDEDFNDLAESLDLEVIEKDVLKTMKTPKEVGTGTTTGMSTGGDAKSPIPKSQSGRLGGKPVETGKGPTHNGYNKESSPKVADMGHSDNRRKKSTDGSKGVPAPKNSDTADNKKSPLSNGGSFVK